MTTREQRRARAMQFGDRLREAREAKGWSQTQLAMYMRDALGSSNGYSQKKISRIEGGQQQSPLRAEELSCFRELLSLTEADIRLAAPPASAPETSGIRIKDRQYLLSASTHQEFQAYLGVYHGVYQSTNSQENRLNRTLLEIFEETDGSCAAKLDILDDSGTEIKHYKGTFFLNTHFQTCYFVLVEDRWQEVSLIIAPYFSPTLKTTKNKFIAAQVLTCAAGKRKQRTVAHRMLFSRARLSAEQLELASSQLRLNTDMIYIRPEQLDALQKEAEARFQEDPSSSLYPMVADACQIVLRESKKITLLCIEESKIYDDTNIGANDAERAIVTAFLRKYSDGLYYNKISGTVLDIIESIIDWDDKVK